MRVTNYCCFFEMYNKADNNDANFSVKAMFSGPERRVIHVTCDINLC